MKRLFRIVGLVLALPLLLVFGVVVWGLWQVAFNKPSDDAVHVEAKHRYLQQISALAAERKGRPRPNVLIVYYDDMGYGDLGFTGSQAIATPNIDALARAGVILSNYHSPSPVCSPSRAGMLTGRLPPRAGVPNITVQSDSPIRITNYAAGSANRLPAEEITIADVLKADGYRTGIIGKWHLGDIAPSLPNDFGFKSFYGSLYSNDMPPFAIHRNGKVEIPAPADQTLIDRLYTDEAVSFINRAASRKEPFFLYFAHNFPHRPLHAPPENHGRSQAGLYGDVIEGLDDGIGRIVAALTETGQLDDTILIVTSDNGPWYQGSPGHSRGRKGQTFEGGMHVPFLIHWPSGLSASRTVTEMAMGTDLFPTLLDFLDLPSPSDRVLDGTSLGGLLTGKADKRNGLTYFYSGNELMAVSDGRFKYHTAQPYLYIVSGLSLAVPSREGPWLFDLSADPDESYDVGMKYPQVASRLKAAVDTRNREMAGNRRGWK